MPDIYDQENEPDEEPYQGPLFDPLLFGWMRSPSFLWMNMIEPPETNDQWLDGMLNTLAEIQALEEAPGKQPDLQGI